MSLPFCTPLASSSSSSFGSLDTQTHLVHTHIYPPALSVPTFLPCHAPDLISPCYDLNALVFFFVSLIFVSLYIYIIVIAVVVITIVVVVFFSSLMLLFLSVN